MSTVTAKSRDTIILNEGKTVNIHGNANSTGSVYKMIDSSCTNSSQSWSVSANSYQLLGPFAGTSYIYVVCDTGSIDCTISDGVISAAHAETNSSNVATGNLIYPNDQSTIPSSVPLRPIWKKDNFRTKSATVIDDMLAAVGSTTLAWTKFTGTCVLANSTAHVLSSRGCDNALKLTNLSSFERIQKNFPAGIVPSAGTLCVPFYITEMPADYSAGPPTPPTYQTASIQVILSVDSGFATTIATSLNLTSSQFLRSGWNFTQWNTSDDGTLNTTGNPAWVFGGTAPGTKDTTYYYMRIVLGGFQPLSTTTPIVYVGGVFQGGTSTPQVMINVDDGHVDTIDIANLAQKYGIKIVDCVITGTVGVGAQMSWAQHQALYAAGHDIISHTRTHPAAGLTTLTTSQLTSELLCKSDLNAQGLSRTSDVLAYPENIFDDRVIAAVRSAGYTLARASVPGWLPTVFGIDQPFAIGCRDMEAKTLAQIKLMLDSAQIYGGTQILYGHKIYSVPCTMTYSAGVITVNATAHGYVNGNTAIHRGADQPEFNVAGIVENAGTNIYTFKVTGTFSSATATSATGNLRTYSPNYPASSATPAAGTYLYWSVWVGVMQEIAARYDAGTLTPVTYSMLLDRVNLN